MKKLFTLFALLMFANATFGVITINPSTIDTGYCQHTYSFKCTATGGRAPYAYTVSVGTLPTGLFLNRTTGVISGTAINYTAATSVSFTVRATDALNVSGTRAYTMYIVNYPGTWENLWPVFKQNPNPSPTSANWYDMMRLYLNGNPSGLYWGIGGSTIGAAKKLGSADAFDVQLVTGGTERAKVYGNGNGFNVTSAYYLAGSKFAWFPNAATGNTSIGTGAGGASSASSFNTNVGALTLAANTSGDNNTAIGYSSQRNTTTGVSNTSIGYQSLNTNTAGAENTAVGKDALLSNTTGNSNSGFGKGSLSGNTTGINNTGIGYNSLLGNTTGNLNTGVGYVSLVSVTTGNYNTGLGSASVSAVSTGSSNTGVGYNSLNNTTGDSNTGFGTYAGSVNTTGNGNTWIGSGAYANDATASYNTIIGASNNAITGSNNIAISDGQGVVRLKFISTGALSLTTQAVSTGATTPDKYLLITINGTSYKLPLELVP